jgi:uncharacterized membrane protein
METNKKYLLPDWPIWILLALELAGSLYLYPHLHAYAFLSFFITLGLYLLMFLALPAIDPHRDNYNRFLDTFRFMRFVIILSLVALHWLLILAYVHGWHVSIEQALITTLSILWVACGNVMGRVKQMTWYFAVRNRWTLSDERVFVRAQRFAGRALVIAGLVGIVVGFIGGTTGWILFVAEAVVVTILSHVYSYFDYRKTHN